MNLRRKSSNKICKRKRKSKKTQRHTQRRDLAHGTHQKKRLRAPNRERKSSTERSEEAEHERRVSQRLREAIEELQGIETLVSKPQTTRNGDGEEREREREEAVLRWGFWRNRAVKIHFSLRWKLYQQGEILFTFDCRVEKVRCNVDKNAGTLESRAARPASTFYLLPIYNLPSLLLLLLRLFFVTKWPSPPPKK